MTQDRAGCRSSAPQGAMVSLSGGARSGRSHSRTARAFAHTLLVVGIVSDHGGYAASGVPGDLVEWRLPTEVLGAGDAFDARTLGDLAFFPGAGGPMPGPNFGERMAVTHLPHAGGGTGDVIVAASVSGISLRRNASGALEPYPDCDPATDGSRNTGAVAVLRLPQGGLRYEIESIILPGSAEVEATLPLLPCGYLSGCVAGTRLALSGRSLAMIAGGIGGYAEAHPAVSRLRIHRRTESGAWLEERVRIGASPEEQWIVAADVDFVDEDTLVAIAEIQQVTDYMNTPPRELRVFRRTPATGGAFEWTVANDFPWVAYSAHDLGGVLGTRAQPGGTGEWPRIDARRTGADDPDGPGIRVAIGAPGYTVQPSNGPLEIRGAVYRVHLPDLGVTPAASASSARIAEGEGDLSEAPVDQRVGYSVALDDASVYFSAIGTLAVQATPGSSDAIIAIAHADATLWQPNESGDRIIIRPSLLPSPASGVISEPIAQRVGIGFGRDMAVQDGGLIVRAVQYPLGIAGGPVLAQRFEPVTGDAEWRLTDTYETGRPIRDETYATSKGSLAVSDTGLVLLGEPAFGGGLTENPGAAWIYSGALDTNGDGVDDDGQANGVELVVIDEWSVDLGTGGLGSSSISPVLRAIGISEQLRKRYQDQPVRVTCLRTSHLDVSLQPAVLEYSSAMQSSNGYSHIVAGRVEAIDPIAPTLPVANCLRTAILGYRPAHEAELLSDIVQRWPWRAKHRVVLALTHDCDQLDVPNLVFTPDTDLSVVSSVVHASGGTNESRTNLFSFLEVVERANSLGFGESYDAQLVCDDESTPCSLVNCIAPTLFTNGAFDSTLGYLPANWIAARIRADLDRDGSVGAADITMLLGGWGTSSGDVTGDGLTNAADLTALLGAWFANPCQ